MQARRYGGGGFYHLLIKFLMCQHNLCALCFSETWLSEAIPDNALHFPGLPAVLSRPHYGANAENERWWTMFLHK